VLVSLMRRMVIRTWLDPWRCPKMDGAAPHSATITKCNQHCTSTSGADPHGEGCTASDAEGGDPGKSGMNRLDYPRRERIPSNARVIVPNSRPPDAMKKRATKSIW